MEILLFYQNWVQSTWHLSSFLNQSKERVLELIGMWRLFLCSDTKKLWLVHHNWGPRAIWHVHKWEQSTNKPKCNDSWACEVKPHPPYCTTSLLYIGLRSCHRSDHFIYWFELIDQLCTELSQAIDLIIIMKTDWNESVTQCFAFRIWKKTISKPHEKNVKK